MFEAIVDLSRRIHTRTLKFCVFCSQSKSTSKMHVSDDAFRSRTEMHVKMVNPAQRNFIVQDVSSVELVGIEPAEQPLPLLNYEHVVNLRFKEGIMHNLYMI